MPFLLFALMLIAASRLQAQSDVLPQTEGTGPKRTPDYWGTRLEAHVGASFYGSPDGNGVGHSHRFIGQAALLVREEPWTPFLFGVDASFEEALVAHQGATSNLFRWSACGIGSMGFNFGRFLWKPFVTWGNLGMYLNAMVGACGLNNPAANVHHVGIRAGGEISTGQFPFPHYDGIVLRLAVRGGLTAEAYAERELTLLNGWCTLSFYPGRSVVGFSLTYRFIGQLDGPNPLRSHYFTVGVAVQL